MNSRFLQKTERLIPAWLGQLEWKHAVRRSGNGSERSSASHSDGSFELSIICAQLACVSNTLPRPYPQVLGWGRVLLLAFRLRVEYPRVEYDTPGTAHGTSKGGIKSRRKYVNTLFSSWITASILRLSIYFPTDLFNIIASYL